MSFMLYNGAKIGSLTITSNLLEQDREDIPGEITHNAEYITAQCDCGKEIQIWCDDIPYGKNKMLLKMADCGCGIYARSRVEAKRDSHKGERRVIRRVDGRPREAMTFTVSAELVTALRERAVAENRPLSHVVEDLIELGITSLS